MLHVASDSHAPAIASCGLSMFCLGLLAGTEEAKVSAVRAAAVTALQTLLNGTRHGTALSEEQRAAIKRRLSAMAASERTAALAAQVIV